MKKLAIVCTHPIQYYAPVFRLMQERKHISIHVFYTWGEACLKKFDPGFGQQITWNLPLTQGYPFSWVKNMAADPGSHHFWGIKNPGLISDIKNFKPDAILVYGWAYHSHLKTLRYFKGKTALLFRGDSTLLDDKPGLKTFLRRLFLRWVYRHIDHAFYVGKNNKAYFLKHGLKETQLSFAPHAVDNDRFAKDHSVEAEKIRVALGMAKTDLVILFAGKFEPKKDPGILLDAFKKINRNDVHLICAGSGELETQLKAKSQKLNTNIHFLPFQNQTQMPALYQACDVFCLPSKGPGETWGLAVNEAMAAGRAVIVSDKCGCAIDLIIQNNSGAVFTAQNLEDLNNALQNVLCSKAQAISYGKAGGNIIQGFTLQKQVAAFEHFITLL